MVVVVQGEKGAGSGDLVACRFGLSGGVSGGDRDAALASGCGEGLGCELGDGLDRDDGLG